jgi:uncharacterized protein
MTIKKSKYLQIVNSKDSNESMVYHSLFGNPRILNKEGLFFLDLFKEPVDVEKVSEVCEGNPQGLINSFKKLFFLVESDYDERSFLSTMKKNYLSSLVMGKTLDRMGLAISDACNLSCPHCIHRPSLSKVACESKKPKIMSWDVAKKCIDSYLVLMKNLKKTECKIHFGNAEPLTNWQTILSALEYCSKIKNYFFDFSINTNLLLASREIVEVLKKYQVKISTSLDGTLKSNDLIRINSNGQGTFKSIIEKFDLLDDIGYPLDGFSITVTDTNFPFINFDVIDLASERGMKYIAFDYDLINTATVSVCERVEKLMKLKSYTNKKGIDFSGTWDSAFRNLSNDGVSGNQYSFCAAVSGKSLEFDTDGSIKICSHTSGKIGHVDKLHEIFKNGGNLYKIVAERFPGSDLNCFGCPIEGQCAGQCQVTREASTLGDMCDFYRKVTEKLILECINQQTQ